MENSQEFLQEWEKKNNPFYPNEMRWDRVKINTMLAEYEAQKIVLPQANVKRPLPERPKCENCFDTGGSWQGEYGHKYVKCTMCERGNVV